MTFISGIMVMKEAERRMETINAVPTTTISLGH
jgi:hypothetical protein